MVEPTPITGNRTFRVQNFQADHCGLRTTFWEHVLEESESVEWCKQPENYKHVMAQRPVATGHHVMVKSHDRTQEWEFLVLSASKVGLRLGLIRECTRPDVKEAEDSALTTKWIVGSRSYSVIRKSDNAVIQAGFPLKEDAVAWIAKFSGQMAA